MQTNITETDDDHVHIDSDLDIAGKYYATTRGKNSTTTKNIQTDRPSCSRDITPANSPDRDEELLQKVEIRFLSSSENKIPESLAPSDLFSATDRRVKYLYREVKIPKDKILQLIKEGKITTRKNQLDKAISKKSRNGLQEREPDKELRD